MWVYRTGKMYHDKPIVLYEYQPSLEMQIIQEYLLKDFQGICVTDGYQVYYIGKRKGRLTDCLGCCYYKTAL